MCEFICPKCYYRFNLLSDLESGDVVVCDDCSLRMVVINKNELESGQETYLAPNLPSNLVVVKLKPKRDGGSN